MKNPTHLPLWKSVAIKSAKIIFPLTFFSFFFAEPIMIFIYGNQYEDSAVYFRILAVVNLIRIVPYAPVMLALGRSKEFANIHMITAFLIVIMEYLCVRIFPSPHIIALISILCTIFCIGMLLRSICKYMNISAMTLIPHKSLISLILLSSVASVISKVVSSFFPEASVVQILIISFTVFSTAYFFFCKLASVLYSHILDYRIRK